MAALMALILVAATCSSDDSSSPATSPSDAATTSGAPTVAPPGEGPNVVLIMTDDQTLESMRVMPLTRELIGDAGTTFANAFSVFPLCCPARATILTGQYAHNHGVLNNVAPNGGNDAMDHTNTLAVWLREAGYATSFLGKSLNGYGTTAPASVPPGWDSWFGLYDPDAEIFSENLAFFDYFAHYNGQTIEFGNADEDYQTDVLAERTATEIGRLAAGDRPFFLWLATVAPHAGAGRGAPNVLAPAPAPRHLGAFADEPLMDKPNVFEADLSDKPQWVRDFEEKANEVVAARGLPPLSTLLEETWQAHLESLLAVDEAVEEIITALDDAGVLENTVIIFTSDNGLLLGEHRLPDAKIAPYEESIRVPFLVRGPGFPAGTTIEAPVANLDVAPTIVELAGATAGLTMDGISLLDVVADPAAASDRALLLESPPGGTVVIPEFHGVRIPGFTFVDYGLDTDGTPIRELYDLRSDPFQLENIIDDPAYAGTIEALQGIVDRMRDCSGAACQVEAPIG